MRLQRCVARPYRGGLCTTEGDRFFLAGGAMLGGMAQRNKLLNRLERGLLLAGGRGSEGGAVGGELSVG